MDRLKHFAFASSKNPQRGGMPPTRTFEPMKTAPDAPLMSLNCAKV